VWQLYIAEYIPATWEEIALGGYVAEFPGRPHRQHSAKPRAGSVPADYAVVGLPEYRPHLQLCGVMVHQCRANLVEDRMPQRH
jgi:hypothetical protein